MELCLEVLGEEVEEPDAPDDVDGDGDRVEDVNFVGEEANHDVCKVL